MKLVVEIPEEQYITLNAKSQEEVVAVLDYTLLVNAIKNGIPLPKGCDIQRIIPKRVDVKKWIDTECPNPNCNAELPKHRIKMDVDKAINLLSDYIEWSNRSGIASGGFEDAIETLISIVEGGK